MICSLEPSYLFYNYKPQIDHNITQTFRINTKITNRYDIHRLNRYMTYFSRNVLPTNLYIISFIYCLCCVSYRMKILSLIVGLLSNSLILVVLLTWRKGNSSILFVELWNTVHLKCYWATGIVYFCFCSVIGPSLFHLEAISAP